ncbi:MAG: DUF1236 domain-containing protein [Methylocystis sp.]|uniref:DUF1236 domain-containing protein n=1 Tax=Methylocystis sp. TaxID=1911079 RepID=UPI003DA4E2E5
MRTRLFLSAAAATLSLCLSQAYAQDVRHTPTGGEAAKQGESARPQKPGEQGAAAQRHERRDERAQEQNREPGARDADKGGRTGAMDKGEEKRGEAAREGEKHGAATKNEEKRGEAAMEGEKHGAATRNDEKHGAAKNEEKHGASGKHEDKQGAMKGEEKDRAAGRKEDRRDERRGALDEEKERAPTAQRGGEANQPDQGRAGQTERFGARDNERGAAQAERERNARPGQREQRGEMEPGAQQQNRGAFDRSTRGAEATPRGEADRNAFGRGGREAQGGRVQLSQRDETRVRSILSQRTDVQRIGPNVFTPTIGAVVPPSVQFSPLPPDVVALVPQFQGYNYVMVGDDIAIIDPGDREVVAVLGEGGPGARYGYGYGSEEREGFRGGYEGREGRYEGREGRYEGRSAQREERFRGGRERRGEAYGYAPRVHLDHRQERALYRGVINEARSNLRQVCVRVGDRVPESVDIEPVPRSISAEAPDVERFDYFVLNDQVVLVDPDTRIVVDMIEEPR